MAKGLSDYPSLTDAEVADQNLLTSKQVAELAGLSTGSVNTCKRNGWLEPAGTGSSDGGRSTYVFPPHAPLMVAKLFALKPDEREAAVKAVEEQAIKETEELLSGAGEGDTIQTLLQLVDDVDEADGLASVDDPGDDDYVAGVFPEPEDLVDEGDGEDEGEGEDEDIEEKGNTPKAPTLQQVPTNRPQNKNGECPLKHAMSEIPLGAIFVLTRGAEAYVAGCNPKDSEALKEAIPEAAARTSEWICRVGLHKK